MGAPAVLGLAIAALALGGPVLGVSMHLEARHRAAGAADAAALAAADSAVGWIDGDPCALASEVAESMGARIASCTVDSETAHAAVTVSISTPFVAVLGKARAGPEEMAESSE